MEYPFKDLMPLDEVLEREGYYKDWTHLDPEVFYSLTQISEYIKTKGYGVDVRLLIAQLAEHFGLKTTQVVDLANLLQQKFTNLEGVTKSFTNNINSLVAQMEAEKDAVIANATQDSEVILARGGKATLQDRLDETTAQLVETAKQVEFEIDDYYVPTNPIPALNGTGEINVATIKTADVYALYDDLMAKNPTYIKKTLLGNDTSGTYPIYKYEFTNSDANDTVVLSANMHGEGPGGDPKDAAIALYYFLKDICENWQTNKKLATLRWSRTLVVIPIENPWGYDNDSRYNVNGVDLNRNFDYNWASDSNAYKGSAPFSEKESQYVRDTLLYYMNNDKGYEVLSYIPFHAYGNTNMNMHFPSVMSATTPIRHIFSFVSRYLHRKYKISTKLEGVSIGAGVIPSADNYAEKILGIPSATAEFPIFRNDGKTRTSEAITQHVEFYGNLIYKVATERIKIVKQKRLSLLEANSGMSITSTSSVLKDFTEKYKSKPFVFNASTGEITIPSDVRYVKISVQLQLYFNKSSEEKFAIYPKIEKNGQRFWGNTTQDTVLSLGGSFKHQTLRFETPILEVSENDKFTISASTTHQDNLLMTNANSLGSTWVMVEEYDRLK